MLIYMARRRGHGECVFDGYGATCLGSTSEALVAGRASAKPHRQASATARTVPSLSRLVVLEFYVWLVGRRTRHCEPLRAGRVAGISIKSSYSAGPEGGILTTTTCSTVIATIRTISQRPSRAETWRRRLSFSHGASNDAPSITLCKVIGFARLLFRSLGPF